MRTLGRFVIRPREEHGPGDLILGALFKHQNPDLLRPGLVYELRDVLDTLTIYPVGPTAIGHNRQTSRLTSNWMHDVSAILDVEQGQHLLTIAEYAKLCDRTG